MPVGDWQFWVVSVVALAALVVLVRPFLPKRRTGTKVNLTIERTKR